MTTPQATTLTAWQRLRAATRAFTLLRVMTMMTVMIATTTDLTLPLNTTTDLGLLCLRRPPCRPHSHPPCRHLNLLPCHLHSHLPCHLQWQHLYCHLNLLPCRLHSQACRRCQSTPSPTSHRHDLRSICRLRSRIDHPQGRRHLRGSPQWNGLVVLLGKRMNHLLRSARSSIGHLQYRRTSYRHMSPQYTLSKPCLRLP